MKKLSMEPSKWLMVEVLPKDTDHYGAILEFLDNSISAANRIADNGDLTGYRVEISIKKNLFKISDNCGGISEQEVNKDAFKLGHTDISKAKEGDTGRYGIGMKRAFFKLGKYVFITSATDNFYFEIKLDVDNWILQEGWEINLNKAIHKENKVLGTCIEISKLTTDTIKEFSKKGFLVTLEEFIRQRHKDAIDRGLKIVLNNAIIGILPEEEMDLIFTESIKNEYFSGVIRVNKAQYNKDRAGWYISFNNRYIKIADKSSITGWGCSPLREGIFSTKFEDKYSRFRGFIELSDKGTGKLPYNTTKSDIDTSSEVYSLIRELLINITAKVINSFEDEMKNICYKKPVKEVEVLKKYLKANSAKEVGEKTYDEFVKNHNIEL